MASEPCFATGSQRGTRSKETKHKRAHLCFTSWRRWRRNEVKDDKKRVSADDAKASNSEGGSGHWDRRRRMSRWRAWASEGRAGKYLFARLVPLHQGDRPRYRFLLFRRFHPRRGRYDGLLYGAVAHPSQPQSLEEAVPSSEAKSDLQELAPWRVRRVCRRWRGRCRRSGDDVQPPGRTAS